MSATATITTKTKNNVVAVPLEAIVEKGSCPISQCIRGRQRTAAAPTV